ncbi:ankyrin repeat domain-containing protein, partial [Candidatus Bathyarchaeota archaeon]|nr:ankyrin repeat domain-containing protein [Candidatus Bathyarchaeota archaeon]
MLLKHGHPSAELVRKHLETLTALPSTQSKATKLQSLLPQTTPDDRDEMLVQEVSSATQTPAEDFSIASLNLLLSAKADVNALKGRALCLAVAASNGDIVAALLERKLDAETIQLAFPHAIHNRHDRDRFSFIRQLIKAGASKMEATRALAYCVDTYTEDLGLLTLLVENGDTSDGIALVKAVRKGSRRVVGILLEKGTSPQEVLDKAFRECIEVKDREVRLDIANLLLAKDVGPAAISTALLAAVNDVDFELGKVLIEAGGNLEECDSQGIVRACRSGSLEMLSLLLTGIPELKMELLQEAFQAATDVGDLKARTII